jgi:deoxyribodipyrimidine photo-lyase
LPLQYDPQGTYIKTWLPSLHRVPTSHIQCPWVLKPAQRAEFIAEGAYPESPVIEAPNWRPHYQKKGQGKINGNKNERVKNPGPGGPKKGKGGQTDSDGGNSKKENKRG